MRFLFSLLLLPVLSIAADPPESPVEAKDALETIHVRDGFTVQLVASEPMVVDPVAISWGADGRMWVAEMADYPLGIGEDQTSGGRIRILKDKDGDGQMDESTLFAEGLNFPSGVLPWKKGALVTAAPEVLYLEDTNGDGRADKREVLITGFAEDNQQLRVNGLRRGLENWIHCASGSPSAGRGKSTIKSTLTGESVELKSLDFRFRPDTGEIELQSGPTQFGRNRDEWGNWFGCMNSYPLWHYVLEDRYLRRNPHIIPPDPRQQLILPRNPKVYPAKAPQKRFHSFVHNGHYTSSCSGMIYRDELLFPESAGKMHAFSCEPFHNLVQHIEVEESGFTFKAERSKSDGPIDFFASTDRWCRPVQVRTGPDGAIYIVDMYRYVIEHSQFLAATGMKDLEPFLREGDDRGRIYRVFPTDSPPRKVVDLSNVTPSQLVDHLQSPVGPVRDMVQEQLIQSSSEKGIVEKLEQTIAGDSTPESRVHALHTLQGLKKLSAETLQIALKDAHPGVRRNATRLTETLPHPVDALLSMTSDPSSPVRLQLAATLGMWPDHSEAAEKLGELAIKGGGDPFFDAILLSSTAPGNIESIIAAAFSMEVTSEGAGNLAGKLLALSVAFNKTEITVSGLQKVLAAYPSPTRHALVAGLLDSLNEHGSSIEELLSDHSDTKKELEQFIDEAKAVALNPNAPITDRANALRLMGRSTSPDQMQADFDSLSKMLNPSTPSKLQSAIISHLAAQSAPFVADALLSGWKRHGPAIRAEILGVVPTRRQWMAKLLDAFESGAVSPSTIGPVVQRSLRAGTDAAGRKRLAALFADDAASSQSRKEIIEKWKPALNLKGDRKNGAEVFKTLCAACHQLDGFGNDVGPDLTSLSDKRPIALFTAILDPNAQLDARYSNYVATTKDGKSVIGFLAAETSNSLTLKGADGSEHKILRTNLEALESTGLSLMPEGLEAVMDQQKLADLIAYLEKAGLPAN